MGGEKKVFGDDEDSDDGSPNRKRKKRGEGDSDEDSLDDADDINKNFIVDGENRDDYDRLPAEMQEAIDVFGNDYDMALLEGRSSDDEELDDDEFIEKIRSQEASREKGIHEIFEPD